MLSNTIAAWLIYFVVLGPCYLLCIAHVIAITVTRQATTIQLNTPSLSLLLSIQGLMILASPASCYGWKQGQMCYSLAQTLFVTLFTDESLQRLTPNVSHWSYIESAFLVLLGLYIATMILFLATLRVES